MAKRGGYFPHAERWGRKSVWQNLPTALIRVPGILIDKILNYAHTVDSGKDYERQVILTALNRYIEAQQNNPGGNQHRRKGEPLNIEESRDWKHFVRFMKEIEKVTHSQAFD